MKIHPFQAIYPRLEFIASSDSFFGTVKREYPEFKQSGFFHKSAQEGIYIYQIEGKERSYLGIIATSDINDYLDGKILKHENTLPASEQTQLQLFLKRKAAVKPVLLAYPKVNVIDKWLKKFIKNKPAFLEIEFELEQKTHRFWEVSEGSKIEELQNLFDENVPQAYIADGHHRTSTAAILYDKMKKETGEKYRNFFTTFFSFEELEIFDFNRIVYGLNDMPPEVLIAKLSEIFEVKFSKKPVQPRRKYEIVMLFNKNWYRLRWKKKVLKKRKKEPAILDANLLNTKVLQPILGIGDVRSDKRIKYVEGLRGMEHFIKTVGEKPEGIGFLLYRVDWQDFLAVAETGNIMPPKSTWFEPRMKNGALVQEP